MWAVIATLFAFLVSQLSSVTPRRLGGDGKLAAASASRANFVEATFRSVAAV